MMICHAASLKMAVSVSYTHLALYLTIIEWRVAERSAEYVVASFVGIEDVAGALSQMTTLHREEAELSRLVVAWLLPVSYTHLDVYKRHISIKSLVALFLILLLLTAPATVSYTHLSVTSPKSAVMITKLRCFIVLLFIRFIIILRS